MTAKKTAAKRTVRPATKPEDFTEPVKVTQTHYHQPTTEELVAHVKQVAVDCYEDGGWDVIVETWDDDMIREKIGRARTFDGAIRKVLPDIFLYQSQERERAAMLADA